MKRLVISVKRQTGAVLILTMVALLTMTLLTAAMMRASLAQMQMAANAQYSAQPMENAESIMRDVENNLDILDDPTNPSNKFCSTANNCNCRITVVPGPFLDNSGNTVTTNVPSDVDLINGANVAQRDLWSFPQNAGSADTGSACQANVPCNAGTNPNAGSSCTCTCPEKTNGIAMGLRDALNVLAASYGNNPDGSPVVTLNLLGYGYAGNFVSGAYTGGVYREFGIIVNTSGVRGSTRSVESRFSVKY